MVFLMACGHPTGPCKYNKHLACIIPSGRHTAPRTSLFQDTREIKFHSLNRFLQLNRMYCFFSTSKCSWATHPKKKTKKQFNCAVLYKNDSSMLGIFLDLLIHLTLQIIPCRLDRFQGEAHDGSIWCAPGGPRLPTPDLSISGHAATEVVLDLGGGASQRQSATWTLHKWQRQGL